MTRKRQQSKDEKNTQGTKVEKDSNLKARKRKHYSKTRKRQRSNDEKSQQSKDSKNTANHRQHRDQ